jgi:ribosomal protein S18 acetylase RimI-like enzyme
MSQPKTNEEETGVVVRTLKHSDLEDIIGIDAHNFGKPRRDYYRLKLELAMADTSVRMSLGAEVNGKLVGFLFGSMFHGDYGLPEPLATLDALGVHSEFSRRGVATALWEQFVTNLKALRVDRIRTQVPWSNWELMTFFHKVGFLPGSHLCVDRKLEY